MNYYLNVTPVSGKGPGIITAVDEEFFERMIFYACYFQMNDEPDIKTTKTYKQCKEDLKDLLEIVKAQGRM